MVKLFKKDAPLRFILLFLGLFLLFYFFNILFFGLTTPGGGHYNAFLANNLDYISALRHFLLNATAKILNWLGYGAITDDTDILVAGHGRLKLIYSCLGLGIMSFLIAFVIAYPRELHAKLLFIIPALLIFQVLNILRFVILSIFWNKNEDTQIVDHHTIFNIFIYITVAISLYFWVKRDEQNRLSKA